MLYLEEKKDWITVAWQGKRNFLNFPNFLVLFLLIAL